MSHTGRYTVDIAATVSVCTVLQHCSLFPASSMRSLCREQKCSFLQTGFLTKISKSHQMKRKMNEALKSNFKSTRYNKIKCTSRKKAHINAAAIRLFQTWKLWGESTQLRKNFVRFSADTRVFLVARRKSFQNDNVSQPYLPILSSWIVCFDCFLYNGTKNPPTIPNKDLHGSRTADVLLVLFGASLTQSMAGQTDTLTTRYH